jgi:predicted O-linked N-acetylglucosamine transferase (SPINDLY family)
MGVPELIARSDEEYRKLATRIVASRRKMDGLKEKIERGKVEVRLFFLGEG